MEFMQSPYGYCSAVEAVNRQSSCDIDPLESTESTKLERREFRQHDPLKIIRKFYRSAIGEDMQSKYPSRSNDELYSCTLYLQELWNRNKTNACNTYGFVMDRIRAIRQEIVIGNSTADSQKVANILDAIITFYVQLWEDIKLSSTENAWFDEVLHERALSSCLASIITISDVAGGYISYLIYLRISRVLKQELLSHYADDNYYFMRFPTLSLSTYDQYLAEPTVLKAIKCIVALQQGNVGAAMKLMRDEGDSIVRSLYFFHILPYLRLWRYLLIRNSINVKAEELMVAEELFSRLHMTKSALDLLLSHCNVAIDVSTDTVNTIDFKVIPLANLLNSFLIICSRSE